MDQKKLKKLLLHEVTVPNGTRPDLLALIKLFMSEVHKKGVEQQGAVLVAKHSRFGDLAESLGVPVKCRANFLLTLRFLGLAQSVGKGKYGHWEVSGMSLVEDVTESDLETAVTELLDHRDQQKKDRSKRAAAEKAAVHVEGSEQESVQAEPHVTATPADSESALSLEQLLVEAIALGEHYKEELSRVQNELTSSTERIKTLESELENRPAATTALAERIAALKADLKK